MRDWYQEGYINTDAATLADSLQLQKTGNVLSIVSDLKPGGLSNLKIQLGGVEMEGKTFDSSFVTNDNIAATLQVINKNSKNPERALMFVELLNTDKELYNLMCYGIEGVHYKKAGDNRIEPIANSGYAPNKSWAFGKQFNGYLLPGQPDTVWQDTIDLNNKATTSKLLGFVFNQEPVKTEIAQTQSVMDEYLPGLITGFVDPDKYLPDFLAKLKTAGADKIMAEKQKQIDAWKSSTP